MAEPVRYQRVLLKVSGEAFAGSAGFGFDTETIAAIAREIVSVQQAGCQVAVVVGGGNIIRGKLVSEASGIERTVGDNMGMLATIINALALQGAIEKLNVPTRVQSAISVQQVCEPFIRRRAIRHMEKGRIVVFAGGTGNPYFTTDTAAVLRALEIDANLLLKATAVDGIYDKDPKKHADAVKYDRLEYSEAISRQLAVMDQTAFTMCREQSLPIIVLDLDESGAMLKAVQGKSIGTLVEGN